VIEASFVSFITADAGIAAVSTPAPKLYVLVAPEDHADPFMTFSYAMDDDPLVFSQVSSLLTVRFDIHAFSTRALTAATLADAIYDALVPVVGGARSGYRGTFGSYVTDFVRREFREPSFEGGTRLHRVHQRFLIRYHS